MMKKTCELRPCVATIGFFDGVHEGHVCLVRQLREEASRRGMRSMLVTFDKHPRTVVCPGHAPLLLTTLEEKEYLLRQTGVDEIAVLPFTEELSRLTARDFMQKVLYAELDVRALVLGYDHVFGHGGGSADDYVRWGGEIGIEIIRARELADRMVSSSRCRRLLEAGDVCGAAGMLGRAYHLEGVVVKGFHVGHEIGFPTANLRVAPDKLIPARGAYAVWVVLPDGSRREGMLNIGSRPTIGNGDEVSIEVNVFDYEGDLYEQRLVVEFVGRLRNETSFSNREELAAQLVRDKAAAHILLRNSSKE